MLETMCRPSKGRSARYAGREPVAQGLVQDQRAQAPDLFLEQTVRAGQLERFHGVGADQLRHVAGAVDRRGSARPHLVEQHRNAANQID